MPNWLDVEDEEGLEWANDKEKRRDFVGKVFMLTGAMLGICSVIIVLPMVSDEIQEAFVYNALLIGIIALVGSVVSMLTLVCCYRARHIFPLNLILLIILSASYGFIASISATKYSTEVVLVAFGTTVIIVLLVGILAKWGPVDITGCTWFMFVISIGLSIAITVAMIVGIFYYVPIVHLIISCCVVLVYLLFLLFDMQMILGGRREELDSNEYILGAVLLFKDIIIIFMTLLEIINAIMDRVGEFSANVSPDMLLTSSRLN